MADKPAPAKPDLTPFFILFLIVIIAGLGSVRSCQYTTEPPSNLPGDGGGGRPGPPVTTDLKQYTVQVGSFATQAQANAMAATLRSKNINNFILKANGRWLVCVGTYVSEERANRIAGRLQNEGISNPVVLPPKRN
ncbi:SPOR domain-containing protein [candidate division KSB1 bacterium]|nr:SPOR domain-containing protein [candidate division KSB1 bacterium]